MLHEDQGRQIWLFKGFLTVSLLIAGLSSLVLSMGAPVEVSQPRARGGWSLFRMPIRYPVNVRPEAIVPSGVQSTPTRITIRE